jgi:hypothetical protein
LPVALAGTFGLQPAHADIYTWVDASGSINVSNLAPPEGVRVTKIIRARAPEIVAREDAAREAARQAETKALAERVRQLEDEVELAKRQAASPVDYRPAPSPPVVQYIVNPAPPLVQYTAIETPPTNTWCNPTWLNCGLGWGPVFYPASVFVLRAPTFRHFQRGPGGRQVAVRPPMRPPDGFRRG